MAKIVSNIVSNVKIENSEQEGKSLHELVFEIPHGNNSVQFSQNVLLTAGKEDEEVEKYVADYEKEWLEANPVPEESEEESTQE